MEGVECFTEVDEQEEERLMVVASVEVFFVEAFNVFRHLAAWDKGGLVSVNEFIHTRH